MTSLTVCRLIQGDGVAFRSIRLDALERAPDVFGTTLEAESVHSADAFEMRLKDQCVFGAFLGRKIVGMAGFERQREPKFKHKGFLCGMYVRETARNAGIGRALVEAVLEQARSEVVLVTLAVVAGNASAITLYKSCGFRQYGLEERALCVDGHYIAEALMVCDLDQGMR